MNKYLYFQDGHVKGINPSSRTDNYYESWILKFKEILSIAKEKKVDVILDGGDILDTAQVANNIVDDILDLIEETGIPIMALWGNHNQTGHHIETSSKTSFAHMLRRCKLLTEAKEINEKSYRIKFIDYDHGIEEQIKTNGIKFDENVRNPKWNVAIVHAFLTPKPFLPTVLHVVVDDITSNADLVLVAHYHSVWEKQVEKTKYIDIGCLGRCSISEANIHPSCLILDFSKKIESITEAYEIIPLKSAKSGKEVFDLDAKELLKDNEKEMQLFINSLRDFKTQDNDLRGNIEWIAKENKVERAVIERILEKLQEVEK